MYAAITAVWKWVTAPFRNDQHKYPSLARIAATAVLAAGLYRMVATGLGAWDTTFLVAINLILWSDILTSKLASDVLRVLAGRWGVGPTPEAAEAPPVEKSA